MSSPPVPMDLDERKSSTHGKAVKIAHMRTLHRPLQAYSVDADPSPSTPTHKRLSSPAQELTPPRDLSEDHLFPADTPSAPLSVLFTPSASFYTAADDTTDDLPNAPNSQRSPITYSGPRTIRAVSARSDHSPVPTKPHKIASLHVRIPKPDRLQVRDGNVTSRPPAASSPGPSSSPVVGASSNARPTVDSKAATHPNETQDWESGSAPRGRKRRNSTSLKSPYAPKKIALRVSKVVPANSTVRSIPASRRLAARISTTVSISPSTSNSDPPSGSAHTPTSSARQQRPISAYDPLRNKPQLSKSAWSSHKLRIGRVPNVAPGVSLKDEAFGDAATSGQQLYYAGPQRGVAVQTSSSITKGETILRSAVPFAALHKEMIDTHCWGCHTTWEDKAQREGTRSSVCKERYLRCERCQTALWCSVKCYASHAEKHHPECRALRRSEVVPGAQARAIAKVLHARATKQGLVPPNYDLPALDREGSRKLKELAKQVLTFVSRTHEGEDTLDWAEQVKSSYNALGSTDTQLQAVTLEMRDACGREIGLCIVDLPTKIRHSCTPNACVAFPEGLDVPEPLRVISLEDIKGDEEVTTAYASVLAPCHLRGSILLQAGFKHECRECEGQVDTVDKRWASWHDDCGAKGDRVWRAGFGERGERESSARGPNDSGGPQRGMIALEYDKTSLEERECTGCHEVVLTFERSYDHESAVEIVTQWYSEAGADWSIVPVCESDYSTEIGILTTAIRRLEGGFPETVWPLPQLRHRAASLTLLHRGRAVEDLYIALEDLARAYAAHRALAGRATATTVWMRIQMYQAHEEVVGKLLHVGEYMKKALARRREAALEDVAASRQVEEKGEPSFSRTDIALGCPAAAAATTSTAAVVDVARTVNKVKSIQEADDGYRDDGDSVSLWLEEEQKIVENVSRLGAVRCSLGHKPLSARPQPPRRPKIFTLQDIDEEAKAHVDGALEAWSAAREEWRELSAGVDALESGKWLLGRRVQSVWERCQAVAEGFGVDMGMKIAR